MLDIIDHPSPNYNERLLDISMIIIHYTGMLSEQAALTRMCEDKAPHVSCHYMINRKGTIYRLVDENKRAWHAGVSSWQGITDINSCSLGIELENKGHEFGYQEFTDIQIKQLIILLKQLVARHHIASHRLLAHSDIAPLRKQDPGEKFPWHLLADNNLTPSIPNDIHPIELDDSQKIGLLQKIGYDSDSDSLWTPLNQASYDAFKRHFVQTPLPQEKINGLLQWAADVYS